MFSIDTYATFVNNDALHNFFRNGQLVEEWSSMYPMLFDSDDTRIALHQRQDGYHFYEWLAAILLYHTTGLLSLVEQYTYPSHARKRQILKTMVSGEAIDFIARHGKSSVTQCPDLLVYTPTRREWFFCEVKGPRDKLQVKQVHFFE